MSCILICEFPLMLVFLLPVLLVQCKPKKQKKDPINSISVSSSSSQGSQPEVAPVVKNDKKSAEARAKQITIKKSPDPVLQPVSIRSEYVRSAEKKTKKSAEEKEQKGSEEAEKKKMKKSGEKTLLKRSVEKTFLTAKSNEKSKKPTKKKGTGSADQCLTAKENRKKDKLNLFDRPELTPKSGSDRPELSCSDSKKASYFDDQNDDDTLRFVKSIERTPLPKSTPREKEKEEDKEKNKSK